MDVLEGRLFLDDLVIQTVLRFLSVYDLQSAASVCKSFQKNACSVAADQLIELYTSLRVLPGRPSWMDVASRISQLGSWTSVSQKTMLWFSAEEGDVKLVSKESDIPGRSATLRVLSMRDLSGNRHTAFGHGHMPTFIPDALGRGLGALEFDGSSYLETRPFGASMPQPLTLMIVARARGDTTIIDSLTPKSARFELCHGYPLASSHSPHMPEVCMSAHGSGVAAPGQLLRGSTKSTDEWHVYTAIFDGEKSEIYIDGRKEAAGKTVGRSSLDGLRIGCDHTSTYFLRGAIAELRCYGCHMSEAPRSQLETALALRYGINPITQTPAPPPKLRASRLASCFGRPFQAVAGN
jgi:hypothetical protein